jgi:diguanylate cyclase (GGDEF)-like protein
MPPDPVQYQVFRAAAPLAVCILAVFLISSLRRLREGRREDRLYAIFVAATIGYLATNYLEISSSSIGASLFWAKMIYPFISFLPILWLDFAHRFAYEGRGLPPFALSLLLLVPIITLILVFVPSFSGLMWSGIEPFQLDGYFLARWRHGPWFIVYAAYTYLSFLGGAALTLGSFVHYRKFYSRQSPWVICGLASPFMASLLYLLRPFPGLVKDFTPLGYAVAALLFYVALFHGNLFSQAVIGRDQVVERLEEGILAFGGDGLLSDANPSAMRMLGLREESLGRPIADILSPDCPGLLEAIASAEPRDVRLGEGDSQRSYRVQVTPCARGKIVTLADHTELRAQMARAEILAMSDELTGLPNRRRFVAEGVRELARARRRGLFIAAAMIDFDDFKGINDNRGHAVGDAVLRSFGAIVAKEARIEDVTGRIGGDEFAILTVGVAGVAGIRTLCERLRSRLATAEIRDGSGALFRTTISVGIAVSFAESLPGLERLLSDADTALYAAKRRGRDGVFVFGEDYS